MRKVWGIIFLSITLFLVGCSSDEYKLTTFDRNDICSRRLTMYQQTKGSIILNVQESIFNKEEANSIFKIVKNDLKYIEKFNKLVNNKIEIYILDKPLNNTIYIGGNKIYCTSDNIENNQYREELVRAAYNLTEPAIISGLTAYIFDDNTEIDDLKNYYSTQRIYLF